MDNEEEEEEGEGGLETNCAPNPYQTHPPPEGCCTTDGEAGSWAAHPPPPPESAAVRRWVPCAPGYTTPGAVRLTAPRHSVDSCNLMNGFGCNSSFSTLVVWKPEYISQFGSSCADVSLRLMSENNLCPRSYFTVEEGPCMFSQEPCGISMLLLLPC